MALLEGSLWAESLRVLHLHQRRDLVETHFLPALVEAHDSRLSLFQDLRSRFIQHSSRLVVVRENKKLKQTAILGEPAENFLCWMWLLDIIVTVHIARRSE